MKTVLKQKHLMVIFILVMVITLTMGCTGVISPVEVEKEQDTSNTSSEVKKPFDGLTIRLLGHDAPYVRSLKELSTEFEAITGAKAEIDPVGQTIMDQRLQLDFAAQVGSVDVAYITIASVYQWASSEWVKPLDEYIKKDEVELNMNDFFPSMLDALSYKGKIYGLPGFAEVGIMAYRKDVFEKHGITSPPETWDEFEDVCAKIHSDEMAAVAIRAQRGGSMNMFVFPLFMWSYGGNFFKQYPDDLTPIFNSPENLNALKKYNSILQNYGPPGIGNYTNSDVIAAMQSGTVAIIIDGDSVIQVACSPENNIYHDKIALAPIPTGPAGGAPMFSVHGWAIPSFCKYPDLAWEFVKWSTSEEILTKIARGEGGEVSVNYTRASVAKDPKAAEAYSELNFTNVRAEAMKTTRFDYRPILPEWAEFSNAIGGWINASLNGQITPEEALERAQRDLADIIEKAGYEID